MDNDKFQELVLKQLTVFTEGQESLIQKIELMQSDIQELKEGQTEIKTELRGVWDDILRLDKRLTAQDEELVLMKRLK